MLLTLMSDIIPRKNPAWINKKGFKEELNSRVYWVSMTFLTRTSGLHALQLGTEFKVRKHNENHWKILLQTIVRLFLVHFA